MFKTFVPKQVEPKWVLVDAEGQTVGRLATQIARILRGKHKPNWTPNMATGDFVVVINASKARFTGGKPQTKIYTRYTGYQGGLKEIPAGEMLAKHPERVIEHAVKGMLPKGPLGYKIFSRLKVYAGPTHPHQAQNPEKLEVK
ncbi:MAG: 50S ribosomal protein L13 [Deinococcota bacterium]|uniref:Large ribosomal subunit protein uL13 n=1 Tax=Allomeiothermus silvanus (strain ATCC 700542 / DSM 9946 / NBRC 106475 / NCIMB 13440 / VI-R2) TaxID=526227 RepID=D7BGK0_ALLS1|nr:50S ribosomal protein L13 [Allomeiothermus silvanus]ADH63816.1 ribosomal protein L13 [Allomeiothermus silvanus DSM 9946]MBI5812993.1 50S ribosomal protein L13 [Allomeiothermus silvanus]MCL6569126.1 50S ribosomal protein L13 [Allomeiothermus silvanus]